MKAKTQPLITLMHVISWVVFIGLCIKTGALLFAFFAGLFISSEAASHLYLALDLNALKAYSETFYCMMLVLVITISALKAYLFYLVIRIFLKINFAQPFSSNMAVLITKMSGVALAIGGFAIAATEFSGWLQQEGVALATLPEFISGSAEFLFFAGILFIISLVFKKGIEIQSENELTV